MVDSGPPRGPRPRQVAAYLQPPLTGVVIRLEDRPKELSAQFLHLLLDPGAMIYDLLDRRSIMALINEHLDGQQNRRLLIWSLLSFEKWLQHFL